MVTVTMVALEFCDFLLELSCFKLAFDTDMFIMYSNTPRLYFLAFIIGSVKMVYTLIYTLFLGFGLQIGSCLTPSNDIASPRELAIT
jgi:hypothetical protein